MILIWVLLNYRWVSLYTRWMKYGVGGVYMYKCVRVCIVHSYTTIIYSLVRKELLPYTIMGSWQCENDNWHDVFFGKRILDGWISPAFYMSSQKMSSLQSSTIIIVSLCEYNKNNSKAIQPVCVVLNKKRERVLLLLHFHSSISSVYIIHTSIITICVLFAKRKRWIGWIIAQSVTTEDRLQGDCHSLSLFPSRLFPVITNSQNQLHEENWVKVLISQEHTRWNIHIYINVKDDPKLTRYPSTDNIYTDCWCGGKLCNGNWEVKTPTTSQ